MLIVFWFCLAVVVYAWFLYPFTVATLARRAKEAAPKPVAKETLPSFTIVIPVYNSAGRISEKLENTLNLNYPRDRVEIIVVSDGSTDQTVREAKSMGASNVTILHRAENRGKSSAQNYAVGFGSNDILVLTDVDAVLDPQFLVAVAPYFQDQSIGCVGGTALLLGDDGAVSGSQGLYWRMESVLRRSEARLGMLFSLAGWAFALRRSDYEPLDEDTGDDMVLPLDLAAKGKKNTVAERAYVYDRMPATARGELQARKRITLRNLTAVMRRSYVLNPFRDFRLAIAVWSHKVLRWFTPVFLAVVFLISGFLGILAEKQWMFLLFMVQAGTYFISGTNLALFQGRLRIPVLSQVSSFLLANVGFLLGIVGYLRRQTVRAYSAN